MKLIIERDQLIIKADEDSELELVFLELVLGLKDAGDSVTLYRHNYNWSKELAYLSTKHPHSPCG